MDLEKNQDEVRFNFISPQDDPCGALDGIMYSFIRAPASKCAVSPRGVFTHFFRKKSFRVPRP